MRYNYEIPMANPAQPFRLICTICDLPLCLETAHTDEYGHPVHEGCYLLKLRLLRASGEKMSEVAPPTPQNVLLMPYRLRQTKRR